jgi:hypothetical protein
MTVSAAQYEAVISKLEQCIPQIESTVNSCVTQASDVTGWIPVIGDWIREACDELVRLTDELLAKLSELLGPAGIPLVMNQYGIDWLRIREEAGGVASAIESQILQHEKDTWQGLAGGAYSQGIGLQAPAANAIASTASTISGVCTAIRNAGYTFYLAVLAGVITLIVAGVIGNVPGLIAAIITVSAGLATAITMLEVNLDTQARALEGAFGPSSTFPGNAWPPATTS